MSLRATTAGSGGGASSRPSAHGRRTAGSAVLVLTNSGSNPHESRDGHVDRSRMAATSSGGNPFGNGLTTAYVPPSHRKGPRPVRIQTSTDATTGPLTST